MPELVFWKIVGGYLSCVKRRRTEVSEPLTRAEYLVACVEFGRRCCYQERLPDRDVLCRYCGSPTKVLAVYTVPFRTGEGDDG